MLDRDRSNSIFYLNVNSFYSNISSASAVAEQLDSLRLVPRCDYRHNDLEKFLRQSKMETGFFSVRVVT